MWIAVHCKHLALVCSEVPSKQGPNKTKVSESRKESSRPPVVISLHITSKNIRQNSFSPFDGGLACSGRGAIAPSSLPWRHPCIYLFMYLYVIVHQQIVSIAYTVCMIGIGIACTTLNNSPIPSFKNCAMHSGSCIQQSQGKFEHGEQLERGEVLWRRRTFTI